MKTLGKAWVLGLVLSAGLVAPALGATPRPPAKGSSRFASPVTRSLDFDGVPEGEAFLKTLAPPLREKLEKEGQVLMGEEKRGGRSYGGYIKAVALFGRGKERAWQLIVEPTRQVLYLPHLTGATAEESPEGGVLVAFSLKILFFKLTYHTWHWFYPEVSRVEWALDGAAKNDIAAQEGYWQLYALGPDRTVGEYGTFVDTGKAIPRSLQDFFSRKEIPKALKAFRAYIDSDGAYRRDD